MTDLFLTRTLGLDALFFRGVSVPDVFFDDLPFEVERGAILNIEYQLVTGGINDHVAQMCLMGTLLIEQIYVCSGSYIFLL